MTDLAPATFARRWYFHIPVLGWIARDLARDFHGNIWYAIVMLVSLVAIAVMTWGLPALGLVSLACVPVMFVLLIALTRG
jgi:hypothetical protein